MRKLIAGFALLVAAIATAHAQAPFADVPKDHWAYEAVSTLSQRGYMLGYPSGSFDGKKAMTRYEFAVAIARLLPQLEQSIKEQISAATPAPKPAPDLTGLATKQDLQTLLTKEDFDSISKLVDQFAPELKMLEVDVTGLRRDLNSLTKRVAKIEDELSRVNISGEMNIIGRGSSIQRSSLARKVYPTDYDGRTLQRTDNIIDPAQVYYDMDLALRLRVNKGIYANTVLNVGNYLGGFASAPRVDFPYGAAGKGSLNSEITPWKAYVSAPFHAPILGQVQAELGKTGIKFTPYTLRLQDYDTYTKLTKTDNGEIVFSGAKGKFNIGPVGFVAYAGQHGNDATSTGMPIFVTTNFTPRPQNPLKEVPLALFPGIPPAFIELRQSAGVHANFAFGNENTLGGTYIEAGTAEQTYFDGSNSRNVKRAEIYGADAKLNLAMGLRFKGEFASSLLTDEPKLGGSGGVWPNNKRNAFDGRLSREFGRLDLTAGYRRIDPFFGAPGAWGSIGSWKNPTNIQGFVSNAELELTNRLSLEGAYDSYRSVVRGVNTLVDGSTGLSASGIGNALDNSGDTKLQHIKAGLKYDLTGATTLDLGLEQVLYKDLANSSIRSANGDPRESYYNFGLGSDLGDNTTLRVLYQIIDYKHHFLTDGQDARGNVAVAQFQVKF
ncbi:MAG TPA: S-layer homology domain-containing protein [Armatimonadota bacterium]|jgi:hypothetical protein